MKKSPFGNPIAPAPTADAALTASNNRLSDRPDWDELLRSLSPSSPTSPDTVSVAGLPQTQQSSPTAADRRQRDRSQHSRAAAAAAHSRSQLAVLLPDEAHLFVGVCGKMATQMTKGEPCGGCSLIDRICECTGDAPFAEQTASGNAWLAVVPLGQPSDREHATALDRAVADAISSGTEAAARCAGRCCLIGLKMRKLIHLSSKLRSCRALEFRSEAAQHCSADVQQRLMGRMRNLVEGELCPAVPAAPAVEKQSGSTMDDVHSGTTGSTAFRNASASLAVSIFMADLVA